ncbi:hypothetical protein HMPREF9695_01047 [Afipia broomeae ATCC 49717]|uniref:DUF2147 domain-containing protein n=2 Tax=Afipia broomeae TaxID=56946 RepID=K8PQY8_9BRAD|nr:DUF2147 domain-containing protein [Afipia broomeae]EKS41955.1 hypothetical protein HMPREF9695_01047 [Afipia broomeae ATCC 49717]
MRKLAFSGMFLLAAAGAASAAEPLGEWKVEDDKATIRIVECNSRLWGVIASEQIPGNLDSKNPDKTKRTRPTLGIPILLNMKKADDEKDKWEGQIYDATSGKTYDANIQLKSPNSLRVEGCVAMILCGGQTWTRVAEGSAAPVGAKAGAAAPGAPKTTGSPPAPKTTAAPPFPTPVGAPKTAAPKGAKAGDQATSEICLLPEIASAPAK